MKCLTIVILLMTVVRFSDTQRKIKDGATTEDHKRYMVYLLQAKESSTQYDEWLCGGAIVTETLIVTSAACVTDVKFMYAIAGYHKYVNFNDIDNDECTKHAKRKVVKSCVPKGYQFDYDKTEKWSQIDIATVEVEKAFDFTNKDHDKCSYKPNKIPINYNSKYQKPSTDVFMLGWGHKTSWRQTNDKTDLNTETLVYGSSLILNKEQCMQEYKTLAPELVEIIRKYMICTSEKGILNDKGELIDNEDNIPKGNEGCVGGDLTRKMENCDPNMLRTSINKSHTENGQSPEVYEIADEEVPSYGDTGANERRLEGEDNVEFLEILESTRKTMNSTGFEQITRKQGICQNDHGGPLITWRGKQEILIGIASVFSVNNKDECVGPYLFTSTHCNSLFLDCVINRGGNIKRMGSEGNYEYIVGSGPDPAYMDHVEYFYDDGQVFDGRRGPGDLGLDESRMAPACQRSAEKMGFKFEFRRINWNDTKFKPDRQMQLPKVREHIISPGDSMEEIKVRLQIPIREYAANKAKSKTYT